MEELDLVNILLCGHGLEIRAIGLEICAVAKTFYLLYSIFLSKSLMALLQSTVGCIILMALMSLS